jgi:hypothetical protein
MWQCLRSVGPAPLLSSRTQAQMARRLTTVTAATASAPVGKTNARSAALCLLAAAASPLARRAAVSRAQSDRSLPGLGTWRLGGRDVRPDRVVC